MSAIRSKDTKPEMIVRKGLWKRGFRYGHNVALPQMSDGRGQMEDVIENSECCKIPKSNREFWVAKIRRNKERDKEEQRKLAETPIV